MRKQNTWKSLQGKISFEMTNPENLQGTNKKFCYKKAVNRRYTWLWVVHTIVLFAFFFFFYSLHNILLIKIVLNPSTFHTYHMYACISGKGWEEGCDPPHDQNCCITRGPPSCLPGWWIPGEAMDRHHGSVSVQGDPSAPSKACSSQGHRTAHQRY